MKFCDQCAATVSLKIPAGDHLPRFVCDACGTIHYQNPRVVTGCIPEWGDRILLCRRGIEPRHGLWTLPAGFMENSETVEQGAARETREETEAEVTITSLYAMYSIPHINQVYLLFRASLVAPNFRPTPESLEVELFSLDSIPWDELAFPVVKSTLEHYLDDYRRGEFGLHTGIIHPRPRAV